MFWWRTKIPYLGVRSLSPANPGSHPGLFPLLVNRQFLSTQQNLNTLGIIHYHP